MKQFALCNLPHSYVLEIHLDQLVSRYGAAQVSKAMFQSSDNYILQGQVENFKDYFGKDLALNLFTDKLHKVYLPKKKVANE